MAQDLDLAAYDAALNDGQMWENLPESAKNHYRSQAAGFEVCICPLCGEHLEVNGGSDINADGAAITVHTHISTGNADCPETSSG